jgi:hypothetical protein
MKKIILIVLITLLIIFGLFVLSNKFYSAGNLTSLDYPVNSNIKTSIIRKYCDTLIEKKGYRAPNKWSHLNKLVELDSVNNVRIYFKTPPEEMYLISFGGILEIIDVYNVNIRDDGGYIAKRELISTSQEERI